MSEAPHRPLSKDEVALLWPLFVEVRGNARALLGVITTFVVPILAVMAFVVLYPPFWNPNLAASSLFIDGGVAVLYLLWAYRIYQPVRSLREDLRAGEAEAREGEVGTCRTSDHFVTLTLADEPDTVLRLAPPVLGPDERRDLSVGQRIRLEMLPRSGRLLWLNRPA